MGSGSGAGRLSSTGGRSSARAPPAVEAAAEGVWALASRQADSQDVHARLVTMKNVPVAELLELPVDERIRLVELLWDSIAALPEAVSIPDELKIGRAHV